MSVKNKLLKITSAAAACVFIAASFSACGENTVYIGSSAGKDIPSGIYIYALLGAYAEAQSKMTENDTDVFAITIEEKNASDWMIQKAKDDVKHYLAIEQKFDEYGLSFTEDENSAAKITVDSMWEYYGSVYEDYGISKDSFLKCYKNTLKSDKIFEHVYGDGGERAVGDQEIQSYMNENYALINYISMNLVDGEGNLLKSAGKAEIMEMAKDYAERAKNGEDFDKLNEEYMTYFNDLKAAAEAAAAETAVSQTDGGEVGNIQLETVDPSDAEAMSGDEETSVVTSAPEEGTSAETTVPAAEQETSGSSEPAFTQADLDSLLGNNSSETTSEETVSSETSVTDSSSAETAAEELAYPSNKTVIKKDSDTPDKTVCDKVFGEMQTGDVTIVEEDEYYYVVYKMDLSEDPTYYLNAEDSLLYEMKKDDFDALCKEWEDSVEFTVNEESVARYTPQKFAEKEKEAE